MDLRKGTMFQVNPLGVRVLDLLDEQRSFAEIANQVSTEFGISLEVVRTDVAEYFDALAAHGVLDPSWSRD